jgi:hypothetical protein
VTTVARFRIFGRAPQTPPAEQADQASPPPSLPPYPSTGQPPPVGAGVAWPAPGGPATQATRPAFPAPVADEPATDPYGFPRTPPGPAWPARVPPAPNPADAAALAGAFAVDYLSWDEDDPARRGRVLHGYLAVAGSDPARIGWTGRGRQRADFALPGSVRADGDGRVLVDVRVRVTPYRSVGEHDAHDPGREPEHAPVGVPAVAPAPTGRGWRSVAACWVRLSVPVVLDGGRLAIDAWEETLDAQEPPRPADEPDDHTLAEDDPLAEHPGGAW